MVIIRHVRKNEVGKLQNLNDEAFIDNPKYDPDLKMDWAHSEKGEKYFTKLVNNPNACCLVTEENSKLVGYIAAVEKRFDYRKSKYIEIENIGIIPAFRSKGIGSLLIKKCLEWARRKGFQKVYVNVYFQNQRAIKFYKKSGFSEIDISLERDI